MANVLKVKHRYSGAAGAPSTLGRSELAFNELSSPTGGILYIGTAGESGGDADTKLAIGGPGAYTDLASSQTVTNKDLTSTTNSFTAAGLAQAGVVELATGAETNTGTDAARAVTPDGLDDWTGSARVTTLGTIATGVWSGTALVAAKVPNLEDLTVGDHIDVNAKRIGNLAAPVAANDAARKTDVDAAVQGLDVRDSVRAASTGNLTLSGTQTIDGVSVVAGDRVLAKNQSTGSENGIYVCAASAWSRAADLNANGDCSSNMFFFVEEGTGTGNLADTGWVCTTNETVTLANMVFAQFSGTGSFTAGDGLDITGTAFSLDLKSNGGLVIESTEVAVDLGASSITGTLAVADGGTGATTLTVGTVLLGNAVSAITQLAKQAAGKILTSEGTAGGDGAVWSNSLSGITIDCGTF